VQARFGANLRECRRTAGLSQERLGFMSGMHRTEISLLERGARDPRLSTIARLALALGKDSAELVGGIVPPDE
jgi:transcriptional regulator with XRE-family HTH domain